MPFVRIILPFTGGMVMHRFCSIPLKGVWIAGLIGCLIALAWARLPQRLRYPCAPGADLAIVLILAALGYLLATTADRRAEADQLESCWSGSAPGLEGHEDPELFVTILGPPSLRKKSWRVPAEIKRWSGIGATARLASGQLPDEGDNKLPGEWKWPGRGWRQGPGEGLGIYLYFPSDTPPEQLPLQGSGIRFRKRPARIRAFVQNAARDDSKDGRFDYAQYCADHGIYFQVFLRRDGWTPAPECGQALLHWSGWLRDLALRALFTHIPGRAEAGFAQALLTGYREGLDEEILEAYRITGVVHVIAVSGLHLGMIYLLLQVLVRPVRELPYGRFVQGLLVLAGIWSFTLIAGAAPSICRAAVMFTVLLIGRSAGRHTGLINNLAASAYLLLCVHPGWLYDLGFQLSYAALLGIALFAAPLQKLLVTESRLAGYLWQLVAASISAQALAGPICWYYFQQFPNWFILANLVAVPLTGLLLYACIAICGLGWLPPLADGLGGWSGWLIRWLNGWLASLSALPGASTGGAPPGLAELALVYLILGFTASWMLAARRKHLLVALAALMLFFLLRTINALK